MDQDHELDNYKLQIMPTCPLKSLSLQLILAELILTNTSIGKVQIPD